MGGGGAGGNGGAGSTGGSGGTGATRGTSIPGQGSNNNPVVPSQPGSVGGSGTVTIIW